MSEQMEVDTELLIPVSDMLIHRDDIIGRGGFGEVATAHHPQHGRVAVKLLIDSGTLPARNIKDLMKEARRLKESSDHAHIVDLVGVLMERDHYGLVLELMLFGSSSQFVKTFKQVEMPLLLRMTSQVISAMSYLHAFTPPILHLDMKADNVLIDKNLNAKICDFGLSEWRTVTVTVTRGVNNAERRCTVTHIAPEVLRNINAPSTKALDVYAFGITLWEIFSNGEIPYGKNCTVDLIKSSVISQQRPDLTRLSPQIPFAVRMMMIKCWNDTPAVRSEFTDLAKEIDKIYKQYEAKVPRAIKNIRQKIIEKYAINDEEYIGTEYMDDIVVADDNMEVNQGQPVPQSPTSPMETDAPITGQRTMVAPSPEQEGSNSTSTAEINPGEQFKINIRKNDLEFKDKQIHKLLQYPLALELVNSGFGDGLPLMRDSIKMFENPRSVQEYINKDTELRFDLMSRHGPSCVSNLHSPSSKNAGQQGKAVRQEKKDGEALRYYSYTGSKDQSKMNAREKSQYTNRQSLRSSSYGSRLHSTGMGAKLLKALREPYYLKDAVLDPDKNTSGEKFEVIDSKVIEAAKDPMFLQILLGQDPELLDNLMRNYPEMLMTLLSANRHSYRTEVDRDHSRRMESMMSDRGMMRDLDMHHVRHMRMNDDDDDMMYGPRSMKKMSDSMYMRKPDMMMRSQDERRRRDQVEKEQFTKKKTVFSKSVNNDSRTEKEKAEAQIEIQKILKEAQEKQKLKIKEEKRKSGSQDNGDRERRDKEREAENRRKKEEENRKREAENRKREEENRKREENRKKKEDDKKPGGILSTMYGMFRGSSKETRLEEMDTNESHSIPSLDQLSMGQPSTHNNSRPLSATVHPPTRSSVPPATRSSPTSSSSSTSSQGSASSSGHKQPSQKPMGEADYSKTRSDTTKPSSGATGGATAGATGSTPMTIAHKHAGGGFTQITMNTDMETPPNLQVGNKNMMVVNNSRDDDNERPKKKKKNKKVKLPTSEKPLTMDMVDSIATEIGGDWKRLCRELGSPEAEVEQINHDYHISGVYEMMYQGIQKWMQRSGKAGATIKSMAEHLSQIDRDDMVKKLK